MSRQRTKDVAWVIRGYTLILIPIVVAVGLGCKYYDGPGRDWINNWGPASVAYELLFMLVAFLFAPRRSSITPIAIGVLVATCLIEFSQLWRAEWLLAIRENLFGRLLLGSSFSWWDFPAYVVGCLLGVLLLRGLSDLGVRKNDQADAYDCNQ